MAERSHPLVKLLQIDRRYSLDAYQFVRDALSYAQDVLQMGGGNGDDSVVEEGDVEEGEIEGEVDESIGHDDDEFTADDSLETVEFEPEGEPSAEEAGAERHVTGQQLCEAIRRYALDQYGYMARPVLSSWGINAPGDFGEIVYNLINSGLMKKSSGDRREDFNDVYDFEEAFQRTFEITLPD